MRISFKLDDTVLINENTIKHRKAAEHQVESLFTRGGKQDILD